MPSLVGSEMCIRDSAYICVWKPGLPTETNRRFRQRKRKTDICVWKPGQPTETNRRFRQRKRKTDRAILVFGSLDCHNCVPLPSGATAAGTARRPRDTRRSCRHMLPTYAHRTIQNVVHLAGSAENATDICDKKMQKADRARFIFGSQHCPQVVDVPAL